MEKGKKVVRRIWCGSRGVALSVTFVLVVGIVLLTLFAPWQAFARNLPVNGPGSSIKDQATAAVAKFHSEVETWGRNHQYHDTYDGKEYALNNSYMTKGIGEDLDRELNAGDYQQTLTDAQNELFQLHMLEKDATDTTPFDQEHATDKQLLDHYQLEQSQVIVISTVEQALRLYKNGKVQRGFLITAGSPDLPVVPGLWTSMQRLTNTTFHSPYPKGSPYYYQPTKINYAIMYHVGGYFVHDAWWRTDFGPNTQFPHADPSGNKSATVGTHGCINVPEDEMKWLYSQTSSSTMILIY